MARRRTCCNRISDSGPERVFRTLGAALEYALDAERPISSRPMPGRSAIKERIIKELLKEG